MLMMHSTPEAISIFITNVTHLAHLGCISNRQP